MTSVLVGGSCTLAIFIPDIESAFSFVGGFGGVFMGIFFPMTIKVVLSEEKWYKGTNLLITIYNIIMSLAAGSAATISAIKIIDPSFKFF